MSKFRSQVKALQQMPGMSDQKQDSARWFDNYTRGQKSDMGGMNMSDGHGDIAGKTGMAKGKMDDGSMAGNNSSSAQVAQRASRTRRWTPPGNKER